MNAETLAYEVEGKPDGPTVVFVHGWPDDYSLWQRQVAALGDRFRCVLVTLPNFGATADKRGGYNFPILVELLHQTIERVRPDDGRVSLVTHDWGAYIGYMLEKAYPDSVHKMIALDIGGHLKPSTAKEAFFIMGYQWTLIALWLIGGVIPPAGDWLSRKFAGALGVPRTQTERVRSRFNYPYFDLWSGVLLPWARKNLLGYYKPRCPVLFIYGGEKPVMFHSERWLRIVDETGGRAECIEDGQHWFMLTHPEPVNASIESWLT